MVNNYSPKVSALLLAGDNESYKRELEPFQRYLVTEAGLAPERVTLHAVKLHSRKPQKDICDTIVRFFLDAKNRGEIALFVYNGHGDYYSMSPTPKDDIRYEDLIAVMRGTNFFFINNCCSSGSAIEVFDAYKLLRDKGLVIAATNTYDDMCGAHLFDALLHDYRQRKPFRRRVLYTPVLDRGGLRRGFTPQFPIRRGASLDAHLFPHSL